MEKDTAGAISASMRVYYSSYHLWAARHFTRLAKDIEDAHTGHSAFNIAHRSYVTSAILSAVAFLEATTNELFQDAADVHPSYIKPLDARSTELLAGLWNESEQRSVSGWSILDKYQVALLCCGKPLFDKGAIPFQDAKFAIKLRNTLIHYRPETQSQDNLTKLGAGLKSKHFPLNRLMSGSGNPFFPDHCLGAGCSGWIVEAVQKFADEFFDRLQIEPNYQRVDFGSP